MTNKETAILALALATLVGLKLSGAVAMSWWWVLSPVLLLLALTAFVLLACAFIVWKNKRPFPTDSEAPNG